MIINVKERESVSIELAQEMMDAKRRPVRNSVPLWKVKEPLDWEDVLMMMSVQV